LPVGWLGLATCCCGRTACVAVTAALLEETGLIAMVNPIRIDCRKVMNAFIQDVFIHILNIGAAMRVLKGKRQNIWWIFC
jgi:hypothetical protein